MCRHIKTNILNVMRSLTLAVLLSVAGAATANPIYTDNFSVGFSDVVLPGEPDYTPHTTSIASGFLGNRDVREASYGGNGTDTLVTSGNGSNLTFKGNGTATGLLQLAYGNNPSSVIDMSIATSVSLYVQSYTGANVIHGYVGSYTGSYDNFAGKSFDIAPGFSGAITINLADFVAPAGHVYDPAHTDNLIFVMPLTAGGSTLVLDKMTVNDAVPEPASFVALGAGALALLRRRRK